MGEKYDNRPGCLSFNREAIWYDLRFNAFGEDPSRSDTFWTMLIGWWALERAVHGPGDGVQLSA